MDAQLIPIGPFSGSAVETFESFSTGFNANPLPIMGGAASIQTVANALTIDSPLSFNFFLGSSSENAPGACAVPVDGQKLLGVEDDHHPAVTIDVVFTNSVKAFGAWWGAGTTGSSAAILQFTFFDAADQQIGSPQLVSYLRPSGDGVLEWHGWFSSAPFKHVRVTATTVFTIVGDSFRAGATGFSILTSLSPLNTTQFVLQGNGTTGVVYSVQASTNLTATNWVTVGTAQPDASGALQFTNTSTFRQRFYRLQAP